MEFRICDDRNGISNAIVTPQRSCLDPNYSNGTFKDFIDTTLQVSDLKFFDISPQNPVVVNYSDSMFPWDYKVAGELSTIRKVLFKVLRFNKDLLDLSSQISRSPMLEGGHFIGIHLRGKMDRPASYGTLDEQTRLCIEHIDSIQLGRRKGIKLIYDSVSVRLLL